MTKEESQKIQID